MLDRQPPFLPKRRAGMAPAQAAGVRRFAGGPRHLRGAQRAREMRVCHEGGMGVGGQVGRVRMPRQNEAAGRRTLRVGEEGQQAR